MAHETRVIAVDHIARMRVARTQRISTVPANTITPLVNNKEKP
jgi:hypothetical protein